MTKLAQLIAHAEGFGRPRTIPTLRKNPGDLRHSPHSQHPGGPAHRDDVGTIDTDAHGWEDLERQLRIYAKQGLTLRQMITVYAPPSENDTERYLLVITVGLRMSPDTLVSEALKIQA